MRPKPLAFGILICACLVAVAALDNVRGPESVTPSSPLETARAIAEPRGVPRDEAPRAVNASAPAATYVAHPIGPEVPAAPGETRTVDVVVRNDTVSAWDATGPNPVELSYHLYDSSGGLMAWDGLRTLLPFDILYTFEPWRSLAPGVVPRNSLIADLVFQTPAEGSPI